MSLAAFRSELERHVAAFLWRQWAQLGVSGAEGPAVGWCQDPEALLAATLELARGEPRLFDEVADWLALNEPLLSMQRFRNALAGGTGGHPAIASGVCAALGRESPGFRWRLPVGNRDIADAEPLFVGARGAWRGAVDEAFRAAGLVRGPLRLSHRSRRPVLSTPIAFALRLRELLGVTVRAEVVRVLLLHPDSELGTAQIAATSLYAKRNVATALASLASVGVISQRAHGRSDRWAIDRSRWLSFLGIAPRQAPFWVNWPPLYRGLLVLVRWLRSRDWNRLTPYLQASEARAVAGSVGALLQAALPGWEPPAERGRDGEAFLEEFTAGMGRAVALLAGDACAARSERGTARMRRANTGAGDH